MESLIKGGRWGSLSLATVPLVHSGLSHGHVEVVGIFGVLMAAALHAAGVIHVSVPRQSCPEKTVSLMPHEPARGPDDAGMLVPSHVPG